MPKVTLKTKTTVVVCLLVAVVLSTTMLTVLYYLEGEFRETVSKQQFSMLGVIADEIDSKIAMTQRELEAVARAATAEDLSTPQRAEHFLEMQPDQLEAFDNSIGLVAGDGTLLATIPPAPAFIGKNVSTHEHFRKTFATGKPVISRPSLSNREHHHPKVTFTAPIFDSSGKVIGILFGSHDLMKPNYLGKIATSKLGEHGFLYLCNNDGTIIVHPDATKVFKPAQPGLDKLLDRAIAGFQGTGTSTDAQGRELLSSFKRLKHVDWIISANYLQSDAYAPLRKAKWYLFTVILAALCCSVTVTWLFMRHLTAPLVAFIGYLERITGREKEPEPIMIQTRDEIGTLARAFNRMMHEAHLQKQAALDQEAFTENLLQNSSVATYVVDSRHRVIIWNKACEELTGLRASQVIGTSDAWRAFYSHQRPVLADFIIDGDLAAVRSHYTSCRPSSLAPDALSAEGWFTMGEKKRFLFFDAAPVRNAEGKVIAAIETLQDITDRKLAEESLQKLSLAIEQMPVTVMITDGNGIIEYVNPNFTTVTGYGAEEAIGQNPSLVRSEWHPPEFFSDLWQTILSGKMWRGELRNRRKNGELYWESASISMVSDPGGDIRHFVAVKEDITERKRAEEALKGKDEHIRLLLESTAEAIYGIDMTGACTFANPACAELLGFGDANELLGRNMHLLIHHTRADATEYPPEECPLCRVLRGEGGVHVTDEIFWRADGTSFAVEYWSYPQLRDGEIVGGVVTFFDITERKRAEEEVRRASAAAEAAARAKSEFLANMSHEIRTPLNAALGMLYLLQQTKLSEAQKGYLDKAQTASTMLLKLINDVLDFSKIEAGKLELEKVPFRLGAVLADLSSVAMATLQGKPIRLHVHSGPEVPDLLVGDPLRLSQVLLNLTSNAIKFTEQGTIDIEVAQVAAADGETTLRFSVSDSGIGIPPEKQETLFSAFTQADSSTTRRYGGTGLGLTICKDLVQLMGGEISVTSRPGEGSTFSFTARFLPQSAEQALQRSGDAALRTLPESRLAGARILLVEDNAINQDVAREILERHGLQVDVAQNGAEALEKLRASGGGYHAVLMDVHMPVMDGLEATRCIRRDPAFDHLPIIAMTASATTSDRESCLGCGMNDQVNKPIDVNDLFGTLGRWIDLVTPEDEPAEGEHEWLSAVAGLDVAGALRIVESVPLLKRLLRSFHAENEATAGAVRQMLDSGDLESARRIIHSIKGAGGNLGLTQLSEASRSLEAVLKGGGDAQAVDGALGQFEERLSEVLSSIAKLERDEVQTVKLDRERFAALANDLRVRLEANNLNALELWEEMRPMLPGEAGDRLDATLQSLDFADAARLLDEIMDHLEMAR